MFWRLCLGLMCGAASLCAEPWNTQQRNVFVYGEGDIQVSIQINSFENIAPNMPFQASVMVQHPSTSTVDTSSFTTGGKPLKVQFVRDVTISPYGNIVLSIYNYQIPGMPTGSQVIPPVKVKVAGEYYESLSLSIDIGSPS